MHTLVNGVPARRTLAWAALCALLPALLLAGEASAQEAEPEAKPQWDDLWVPSFAITSGVSWQEQKATVSSRDITNDTELRPGDVGKKDAVTTYLGVNLELLSPTVEAIPGKPRFFGNFELLPHFGIALDIAKEGNPKEIGLPDGILDPPDCPFGFGCYNEAQVTGVGSKTTAEIQTLAYAAAVGASFPVEIAGRPVHIKPSFGWFRYSVKVDGKVLRAIKPVETLPDVREVELEREKTRSFNAIGPGIEIELDVGRHGPLEPSIFFDAHGYKLLGDRRVKMSKTKSLTGCTNATVFCGQVLPDATYEADWTWKADPWIYRFGIGMRFRWVGY